MRELEALKDSFEYRTYLEIRDEVLRLKEKEGNLASGVGRPSDYWMEELSNFDYMLDASPLIVRKLRHHCYHITGLRVYDYRTGQDARKKNFEERLNRLRSIGRKELIVPESRILGGFGYEIDGELYNVDTLKFAEVLIGMDMAGVLERFGDTGERKAVWEIGAGWGGFAYQFKKLFPNVTYVISDFPELFLFSGVYLKVAFRDARMKIYDGGGFEDWADYDFILVSNGRTEEIRGVRPELTVNMVSFQEMTTEQVRAYVRKASELGCPVVYSMNRDRSTYNEELTSVNEIIGEFYRTIECNVLDSDYTSAVKGEKKKGVKKAPGYRHIMGCLSTTVRMSAEPKVGIGMTVYNGEKYIEEALQSILDQTYTDFALLIVDDASTDGSKEIIERYAARDERIIYHRNEVRQGMVGAWRRAFELVSQRFPSAGYFAWASDHDVWDNRWLATMVKELDEDPDVVLAYPHTQVISRDGEFLNAKTPRFATAGIKDPAERFRYTCSHLVGAGNMVYGLFRAEALRKAGIFRYMLLPDRFLMMELSLYGEFKQVPLSLWYRRKTNEASIKRQRVTLFPEGKTPMYVLLPWWSVFGLTFMGNYLFNKKHADNGIGKASALSLSLHLMYSQALKDARKKCGSILNRVRKRGKKSSAPQKGKKKKAVKSVDAKKTAKVAKADKVKEL